MKKNGKKLIALLLAGLMVFTLAACSKPAQETPTQTPTAAENTPAAQESSDEPIKIGWCLKTIQEERWQKEVDTMTALAKEQGIDFTVQTANGDSQLQISQIENMVTNGIDVLMVTAADSASLTSTLQSVHDAGVKIICYDQQLDNAYADAFVGSKDIPLGEQIAQIAADKKVSGNVVILAGDLASGSVPDLTTGMENAIKDLDVTIVMEQNCKEWKAEEGLAYTENAISQYGDDIAAVLCMNDGIASGAIQALEAAGMAGKVVVSGMDSELTALQRIAAGTQTSTLYRDLNVFAATAFKVAVALAKGETVEADETANFGVNDMPWVLLYLKQITAENLDEVFIDSGIYTREEIYG